MKTFVTILATTALGSFVFAPSAVAAENFKKLTGAQILAKFTGMQLTDDVHWRDVYDRDDGTLRSDSMGTKRWQMGNRKGWDLLLSQRTGRCLALMMATAFFGYTLP